MEMNDKQNMSGVLKFVIILDLKSCYLLKMGT